MGLKAAESLLKDLLTKKKNLQEQIAYLDEKKSDENAQMTDNEHELKDEKDYLAKITPDCDWIIGAFEKRAAARAAEMDGLSGAKHHWQEAARYGSGLSNNWCAQIVNIVTIVSLQNNI